MALPHRKYTQGEDVSRETFVSPPASFNALPRGDFYDQGPTFSPTLRWSQVTLPTWAVTMATDPDPDTEMEPVPATNRALPAVEPELLSPNPPFSFTSSNPESRLTNVNRRPVASSHYTRDSSSSGSGSIVSPVTPEERESMPVGMSAAAWAELSQQMRQRHAGAASYSEYNSSHPADANYTQQLVDSSRTPSRPVFDIAEEPTMEEHRSPQPGMPLRSPRRHQVDTTEGNVSNHGQDVDLPNITEAKQSPSHRRGIPKIHRSHTKQSPDVEHAELGFANGGDGARSNSNIGQKLSFWKRYTSPIIMVFCFLLAIVVAISHHAYYSALDGRAADSFTSQQWALRVGTLMALAVSLLLKIAITNAYIQYLWGRLRERYYSLNTIDRFFDAPSNFFAIMSWEFISQAALGLALIVFIWAMPILSIFPASTLSITLGHAESKSASMPVMVPTIGNAIQTPIPDSQQGLGAYIWNTMENQNVANPLMRKVTQKAAISGQVIPPSIPYGVSPLSSFTYVVKTHLPRLKCEFDRGVGSDLGKEFIKQNTAVLGQEMQTKATSVTFNDDLTYTFDMVGATDGAKDYGSLFYSAISSIYTPETGKSRWSTNANTPNSLADGSTLIGMTLADLRTPLFLSCSTYNSSIVSEVTVVNSVATDVRTISISDVGRLNFTEIPGCLPSNDNPAGLCPQSVYRAWYQELAPFFQGFWWDKTFPSRPAMSAMPHETGLMKSGELMGALDRIGEVYKKPNGWAQMQFDRKLTFARALEDLSLNVSLSFMSEPQLSEQIRIDVQTTGDVPVFKYRPQDLLIAYGLGVVLAFGAIVIGIWAFVVSDGINFDRRFSTIAGSAQHPTLSLLASEYPPNGPQAESAGLIARLKLRLDAYQASSPASPASSRHGRTRPRRALTVPTTRYGFVPHFDDV